MVFVINTFYSNSLNHTGLRNQNLQNCVQPDSTASDENKSSSKNSRNNNARAQELLHKHHHSVKKMQTPSVSRRNARERNRVKQVNNGFSTLRTHIPHLKNKTSKVDTLRAAVDYIRALRNLMGEPINMEHLHQGPVLLTQTFVDFCHIALPSKHPFPGPLPSCWNMTILDNPSFYPVKANQRAHLFTNQSDLQWGREFRLSYSVHFFGQITGGRWAEGVNMRKYLKLQFPGSGRLVAKLLMITLGRGSALKPMGFRTIWICFDEIQILAKLSPGKSLIELG